MDILMVTFYIIRLNVILSTILDYMKDLPFRVNSTFLEFIPYPLYFNHPKGSEDKIMDYIEYEYYGNNDLIYKNNHFIQINNWNDTFDM